jgi:hypothetical protein
MQNGKELWISRIYFPMENPVAQVHGAWTGWRDLSPSWTEAARTRGHGGALPVRGVRALGLTSAGQWQCRKGAHWSTSDGGEAA